MTDDLLVNSKQNGPFDAGRPGLAVFDLDYTLTKRGTWSRFVWEWVKYRPHIWLPLLARTLWVQWQYKRGLRPRSDVKLMMMCYAMKGASKDELETRGRDFAHNEVASGLRPGGLEAIKWHQSRGDILILVSAAVDVVAKPIGMIIGFDHVLSTEITYDLSDVLILNFERGNCHGEEKATRFQKLIDDTPSLSQDGTQITFYSDSFSDLAMFRSANICNAVHPDKKLSRHASEQGWPILMW